MFQEFRSLELYNWSRKDEIIGQTFYIVNLWTNKKYFEERMVALATKQDKKKLFETMYAGPTKLLSIKSKSFGSTPFLFLFGGAGHKCEENLDLLDLNINGFFKFFVPLLADVGGQSFGKYYLSQYKGAWRRGVCFDPFKHMCTWLKLSLKFFLLI